MLKQDWLADVVSCVDQWTGIGASRPSRRSDGSVFPASTFRVLTRETNNALGMAIPALNQPMAGCTMHGKSHLGCQGFLS